MKKVLLFIAGILLAGAPLAAGAEDVTELAPGTLVKSSTSSAVYYIDEDLTRHVFPNGRIFKSWFDNFDDVVEVSDDVLADYPLAGTVPYKPGRLLVKITTDPRVYAVDEGGVLRWVKSEGIARGLYGDFWNKKVQDLPDAFFADYEVGDDIDDEEEYDADEDQDNKNLTRTIRAKRMKKLVRHGVSDDDLENRGYGKNKVAVCHNFASGGEHTIYIARPALSAHLNHGDEEGECAGGSDGDDEESEAPILVSSSFSDITTGSATLDFTADKDVTATVYYSTGTPVDTGTAASIDTGTAATSHSLSLSGLAADTTYHVVIVMTDGDGNETTTAELSFSTLAEADATAPEILTFETDQVGETSVHVLFTTDEDVTATVYYSTATPVDTGTASSVDVGTAAASHDVELAGLDDSTEYHLLVVVEDGSGNETTSSELSFTTLTPDTTAPSLVSSSFGEITTDSAVLDFTADEDVTATVYYSDVTPVDTGTASSEELSTAAASHSLNLTGLEADMTYYVVIVMTDGADNETTSSELSFTTLSL